MLNAGISKAAPIADYTVEDFDNLFATNVRSPFFLVQQLLPILGEGSNIIVISSIGAQQAFLAWHMAVPIYGFSGVYGGRSPGLVVNHRPVNRECHASLCQSHLSRAYDG